MNATIRVAGLALALAALSACGKQDAPPAGDTLSTLPMNPGATATPTIGTIALGKSVGADKRVTASSETFGVRDTIYASVETSGTASGQLLRVMWTMGAETVRTDSLRLDGNGPTVSEFHISRPQAWPAGPYRVTVTLDDGPAQTKDFTIR